MMQAAMIVTDWQPQVGRTPTPEQLRDIFQKELLDFGPALFLADRAGAIRWCNSGYRRVAEIETQEGRIGDLLPLKDIAEEIEFSRNTVYREDRYIIGQTTQILKSRLVPVFDNDGQLSGFGGILQMFADHGIGVEDITELTKREESLRQAKEQADVASRAKTHFLANMSHELRTPLNAIIGFADVMRMEMIGPVSNPQYKSYIRDIHASALHLLGIINDILDVSRIEAGKVTLHESVVSVDEIVESVVRLVKERVSESELTRIHNLLSDVVEGRTLGEVRELFARRLADDRIAYDALKRRAFDLAHRAVSDVSDRSEVRIEGQRKLLEMPEYGDVDRMKRLVVALEEREEILGLLDKTMSAGAVTVFIGSETGELGDGQLSLVVAPYAENGQTAGAVGVLGPTRMDYARVMPLVDAAAAAVSDAVSAANRRG